MRLKHLTLQGFKTFASRTDLLLGEGVTAIVGPNGSGKSNVADAVRWVLGEQSLSQLRAKRTEDLIFAGSSNRQPLGMAEVAITLDNSDRLLPLDFAEVTLTRRAYRSGENEYYLNKSRVRLRDILEVASTLGQAYTVVGQGLVDSALSLRPDERRELFEEAAAIRGYFVQREDALRRLGRTEENMARVHDLVAELEPQVKRMERQARQAQEYGKVAGELQEAMQNWYAARWLGASADLQRSGQAEFAAREQVEARKATVAASAAALVDVRREVWDLVDRVSAMHEQRAQLQARHATQSREQAVLAERLLAARAQRERLAQEQSALTSAREAGLGQLQHAEADLRARDGEAAQLREASREVAVQLAERDSHIKELQTSLDRQGSDLEAARRRATDIESRLAQAQRSLGEQESAATGSETALAALSARLVGEESRLEEQHSAFLAAQDAVAAAGLELASAQANLTKLRGAQSAAEGGRRDMQRRLDNLHSQVAALAGEQQATLFGGVRAVVAAAGQGRLVGFVGTVAELLDVPASLETAIEAALGGRLQDVVVERWADAEGAIAMLKQSGAGRATFLPLDTLRASIASNPPRGEGVVGLARDLVGYDATLHTLAESLLGRLVIVEDLPSARRTIASLPANAPWTLATLAGEVVRPGGSVTGGSNTRADDARAKGRTILARERRRRELLASQGQVEAELTGLERGVTGAIEAVREAEGALAKLGAAGDEARKKQVAAQMAHVEQQSVVARAQQEIAWRTGLLGEARRTIEAQHSQVARLTEDGERLRAELGPMSAGVAALEVELEAAREARALVAGKAGDAATRLAVMSEGLRNARTRLEEIRREVARNEARGGELGERLEAAAWDEKEIAGQIEAHAGGVQQLGEQLALIEGGIGPAEHEVRVLEAQVSRVEAEHSRLQTAMLEGETALSHAAVERQRCIGALDSLSVEIAEELGRGSREAHGPGELAPTGEEGGAGWDNMAVAWPLALHKPEAADGSSPSGQVEATLVETPGLERRVYSLKAKLSRIGPVNPLATAEYEALSERHLYLQTQLTDLSGAADSLRHIIAELDRTMRDQFATTFEQVNEQFQHFFHLLFAGGSARLELTNPQDAGLSGVEISAQPPGKRMQPLAALSGGERALTSAALLFALLKVRPVPFCILDEVDAALDESNVTRFRSALQELGDKTQFVIITHNRGTIEAANTIYGVSMAGDGTSQLLSLKVEAA